MADTNGIVPVRRAAQLMHEHLAFQRPMYEKAGATSAAGDAPSELSCGTR